jgi:hypothetical protein
MKSKDPGFAPQPGPGNFFKKNIGTWKILSGLDQLAENVGTAAEGPVAFQRVPEGEG